ncbi:MAG TPA: ice-binding family protein [Patescibacteria group bacterium]|nr:ice-binding family protein [Patescibacteria group bacterium]
MKIFTKILGVTVFCLAFGITGSIAAFAATTPSLGAAATYGILSSTYTNTTAGTTINGDVGFTTGPAVAPAGIHTNYGVGAPYDTAGTDSGSALSALNSQPCTFTFAPGAINISTDTTHGAIGVYSPGVYCSAGSMDVGGPLTLSGSGTYIFRSDGALTSTVGAIVTLNGASACDVFWTPTAATTLAANTTFIGNIIQPGSSAITVGANTTLTGRALAFGGTITTDKDTITVPTCTASPVTSAEPTSTINVVKIVVNDDGGTKTVADFPLFVNDTLVFSGVTNDFSAPDIYTVTETDDSNYTQTFSGDCDVDGNVDLSPGDNKTCTITNDDIAVPVVTTVTTTVPALPDTGFAPGENSAPWNIITLFGIFILASTSLVVVMKKIKA